jgi:gas vesicle protein
MRRNGYLSETSEECTRSGSGWLAGIFSMIGGIGIGAGLLYLLDPDKGEKRRKQIWDKAGDLASSASDYAGDALSSVGSSMSNALGSARDYAGEKLHGIGDFASRKLSGVTGYASDRASDARKFAQRQVFGETREEHRLGVTICALSSMALGAALMYTFDPNSGKNRRRMAREKASQWASSARDYASQAGDAIKSGVNQVRDKFSGSSTDSGSKTASSGNSGRAATSNMSNPGVSSSSPVCEPTSTGGGRDLRLGEIPPEI